MIGMWKLYRRQLPLRRRCYCLAEGRKQEPHKNEEAVVRPLAVEAVLLAEAVLHKKEAVR